MAEPTLYLFDGFNLLHAGGFGSPDALRDLLASWVAAKGARGVLVFDGHGEDEQHGSLEVRWAPDADAAIERLAAAPPAGRPGGAGPPPPAPRGAPGAPGRERSPPPVPPPRPRPTPPPRPPGA